MLLKIVKKKERRCKDGLESKILLKIVKKKRKKERRCKNIKSIENFPEKYYGLLVIHSKSEQIGGDLLLSTEKLAEKVRISGRQNFATKVRLSWKCNEFGDKITYLLTQCDTCV